MLCEEEDENILNVINANERLHALFSFLLLCIFTAEIAVVRQSLYVKISIVVVDAVCFLWRKSM